MALIACPECHQQVSSLAAACPHCGVAIAVAAPAGSPGIPPGGPPGPEQTLWEGSPSAALLVGRIIRTVGALILLPLTAYFALQHLLGAPPRLPSGLTPRWGTLPDGITYAVMVLLALFALFNLLGLLRAMVLLKSRHYRLTNQRLQIESGLLSRAVEEIDMRYVDETLFTQRLLERLLGIGDVLVVSSDKVAPRFEMVGVRNPRQVRELVRATAYQASQRQFFTRST